MTEHRIEGAGDKLAGGAQQGIGRLLGDPKLQLEGGLNKAKGAALDVFGRAVNALDGQVQRLPVGAQPQARKALEVARNRPFATMAGLAALTFLLTRGRRR